MMRAGKRLSHLPFCGWKPRAKQSHRWGVLRMWPKWKSLRVLWSKTAEADPGSRQTGLLNQKEVFESLVESDPQPGAAPSSGSSSPSSSSAPEPPLDPWSEIKWRPLVSFAGHHLKRLYALAGVFAVYALRFLDIGFGVNSPRCILERFHDFNAGIRSPGVVALRNTRDARLSSKLCKSKIADAQSLSLHRLGRRLTDLKNFFTEVPRDIFMEKLEKLLKWIFEKNPSWSFF